MTEAWRRTGGVQSTTEPGDADLRSLRDRCVTMILKVGPVENGLEGDE